jgi:hypothetical protein
MAVDGKLTIALNELLRRFCMSSMVSPSLFFDWPAAVI